ncbi:hypothetical protein GCM10022223_52980 [Kineosporia mesophila]|uniref:ATP-grasp domain-containing protein n=1 Tax=Kineosporia mesophila TaxID=566012 RepID=A0ABP7AC85_9ACTN|nr:STM4014 family protein [Kineosporia mesophila]MCD5351319.1 STM4014 family protein [Kineosporia mesophila]
MTSSRPLAVVGNPANRRVTMFLDAARSAGLPEPHVFAWKDVLHRGVVPGPGTWVRIDSPGEDAEVDVLLRSLGAGAPVRMAGHGEILGLADAHAGLRLALERIAAGGGRLLNPVQDVLVMGDKRRTHALLASRSVPVPQALATVHGWDDLRARMSEVGWSRVFVKPALGSSASGVLALNVAGARVSALTSVERVPDGRLFNSLRMRRYRDEREVAAIVDRLAPDGLHVERWFPKASWAGRVLDLRVVVTAGRPRHIVVRTSGHAITNLHLGNARGDVEAVRSAAGAVAWEEAMQTGRRVAACFPGSLHVGVDLMFAPSWRRHAVAEVNAFGDLLPRVLADGLDTYSEQIAALQQIQEKNLACVI